jgi:hypothetical protein
MFSHDCLAKGEEQKGLSQFCNEKLHQQYLQFVLLLNPALKFSHDGLAAGEEQ